MTIGELANKAGVNVQTIRYYEREGLLPEAHRWPDSGYRDYDEDGLQRLRFIRSAKSLGFTLREIGELLDLRILPGESCREMECLLQKKIQEVDVRLKELRRLRSGLGRLLSSCRARESDKGCPALWSIERR